MLRLTIAALVLLGSTGLSQAYDRGELLQAQQTLISLGYKPGTPDGALGPHTRAALKSFQTDYGLKPTGKLDAATLQALSIRAEPASQSAATDPATNGDGTQTPEAAPTSDSGIGVLWVFAIVGFGIWLMVRPRKSSSAVRAVASRPSYRSTATPTPSPATPPILTGFRVELRSTEKSLSPLERAEQSRKCWVPANKQVVVAGHVISTGMLYVGTSLARQDGYGIDNCLINPAVKVSTSDTNDSGANVPYYPTYAFLDPASRLSFLKWLEGGKNDPSIYVGYVFIYFYGLERRLMLDDPGEEVPAIAAEVRRLLSIHRDNHSFERYAGMLLGATAVKFNLPIAWPAPSMRKTAWQLPLDILICAGRMIAENAPFNADQMLVWYNAHPDKRLPPLAGRCPDEFRTLFTTRFNEKFPNGLKVEPPKRRLSASYRAASGSFSVDLHGAASNLPDVSGLTAPLNLLDPLIEACSADLATYARLLGKASSSKQAMAAAAALPAQLLSTSSAKPIAELNAWLDERVVGPVATIPLRDLLARVGVEPLLDERIAKADFGLVADALARCNFGIEPDPGIAYTAPTQDSEVVVFRAEGGGRLGTIRPEFLSAFASIHIGMLVATADGVVSPEEVCALQNAITQNRDLQPVEQKRLVARLAFLAKSPPTTRILSRFKDRPLADREAVARLAVSVAAADGQLALEELRLLEKIYKALQLPPARLYSELQETGVREEELPTVASADAVKSVPIPPKPAAPNTGRIIALDKNRLARTRADTAVVSSILGEIFRDESDAEPRTPQSSLAHSDVPDAVIDQSLYPGLDEKYVPLLAEIAGQDRIARADFEVLASKHNLMCDGTIEAMNDWSYTCFDEPILDDGPQIVIHGDLLKRSNREAA